MRFYKKKKKQIANQNIVKIIKIKEVKANIFAFTKCSKFTKPLSF